MSDEFENAKLKGDYIAMNRINRMSGNENFDYTHGGIIAEITYNPSDGGKLYLCQDKTINNGIIRVNNQSVGPNDFIAKDLRRSKDNPNIMIYSSYKASLSQITAIVDALIEYNKIKDPTDWFKTRTRNGLIVEWLLHNLLWFFIIQRNKTADVDLDNNEYRFMR